MVFERLLTVMRTLIMIGADNPLSRAQGLESACWSLTGDTRYLRRDLRWRLVRIVQTWGAALSRDVLIISMDDPVLLLQSPNSTGGRVFYGEGFDVSIIWIYQLSLVGIESMSSLEVGRSNFKLVRAQSTIGTVPSVLRLLSGF